MSTVTRIESSEPERVESGNLIQVGWWYWVKWDNREEKQLCCIIAIGSNYAELKGLSGGNRIHLDEFSSQCERELNFKEIIRGKIEHHKVAVEGLLKQINELTRKLGVAPTGMLEHESDTRSLSTLNQQADVRDYKKELITAKETTLPALFNEVRKQNELMAEWMQAELIPLEASLDQMKGVIKTIDDRVFHVDLYAGLTEKVVRIRDGAPAPETEQLHLMQRRLYMDEECLADYRIGGMDFDSIEKFEAWMLRPANLPNILPHRRCMVAFRVRRASKERRAESLMEMFVNISLEDADKRTFLYIRNGDAIYRMESKLEFGEKIFPDTTEFTSGTLLMAKSPRWSSDGWKIITKHAYEQLIQDSKDRQRKHAAWKKEEKKKPKKERKDEFFSPYRGGPFDDEYSRYAPFDKSNVHYDDICEHIASEIKQYNRIALILQGLFDRSPILHPHGQVSLWTEAGFKAAVTLVFDHDRTLAAGEKPDFEAYRAACNAKAEKGSIFIGQDLSWQRAEAVKENARQARDYRRRERTHHYEYYKPYGNPGPGFIAKSIHLGKKGATFTWNRERERSVRWTDKRRGDPMPSFFTAPLDQLFNVSAYKPGDFRQFYRDPRTRAEYIQWAYFLLGAEEFHAGNLKIGHDSDTKLKGKS